MKIFKITQSLITTILLVLLGAFGGYYFGVRGYDVNVKNGISKVEVINKNDVTSNNVNFERFWEVWDLINSKHIKKPLDQEKLVKGAIDGMIASVGDPYTSYFDVQENTEVTNSLNGLYEGIGAQLGFNEAGQLIIVAPLDGSPALFSGIKSGDRILAIEGTDTIGASIESAVDKIRGKAGTQIALLLGRDGTDGPFEIKITRDTIKLPSVKWEDKGDGIAYIRLSRFGAETNNEWTKSVNEIVSQVPNLKGVILDVRDNPGGFLDSAVFISSEFVSDGVVVKEEVSDGTSQNFKVDHKGQFVDSSLRLVVLVNQGSASASEIVAGALKERRGALIVGQRSFGKGTVQKSEEFADGASLHVTIAKWLTPDGNWIDKHNSEFKDSIYNEVKDEKNIVGGIKPDFIVDFTDEDIKAERDPQLDKSIEIIKSDDLFKSSIISKILEQINASL